MKIADREISWDQPPYLIAEIGVNHDGSLERALDLIWKAARCGADAVKFQAYRADRLAHRDGPIYFEQVGPAAQTQQEFFRRSDGFGPAEYDRLAEEAGRAGVHFLCTPFDLEAVAWLTPLLPAWKIASADITNVPLLQAVAQTGKPVLLSTGAATLREIEQAVDILRPGPTNPLAYLVAAERPGMVTNNVALLHCVLAYPTPAEDANLLMIADLVRRFPFCTIGYSDHTKATPDMEVCTMAYLAGARIIEKHFTDDKTRPGNDHYHSMEPTDLLMLKSHLDWVRNYLGSPDKAPLPVEDQARRFARRGLYASRELPVGTALTPEDIAVLRPTAHIGPEEWQRVLGRRVVETIPKGAPLRWEVLAHGE